MTIELRPMRSDEQRLVVRQWCETFKPRGHEIETAHGLDRWIRVGCHSDKSLSPKLWHTLYPLLVEQIVQLPTTVVAIACFPSAVDVVNGWIAYEPGADGHAVVHYAHVTPSDRRHGIGSLLLSTIERRFPRLRFSHMTRAGGQLVASTHRRQDPTP